MNNFSINTLENIEEVKMLKIVEVMKKIENAILEKDAKTIKDMAWQIVVASANVENMKIDYQDYLKKEFFDDMDDILNEIYDRKLYEYPELAMIELFKEIENVISNIR